MRGSRSKAATILTLTMALASLAEAEPVAAEAPRAGPPLVRLELSWGVAHRADAQSSAGLDVDFAGLVPWHFRLAGAAFLARSGMGVAVDATYERFVAVGSDPVEGANVTLHLSEMRVGAGLAGRLAFRGVRHVEVTLGYEYAELPMVDFLAGAYGGVPLHLHGVVVGASVGHDVGGVYSARLFARVMPRSTSASLGSAPGGLYRLAAGGEIAGPRFSVASALLSPVLLYEFAATSGSGEGWTLNQIAHRATLGLRAAWHEPGPAPRPPSGPGMVRGRVVYSSPLRPAPDMPVDVAGAVAARTDAEGAFAVAGVGPGPVRVRVQAPGHNAAEHTAEVPPGGEASVALTLVPATGPGRVKGIVYRAGVAAPKARSPLPGAQVRVAGAEAVTAGQDGSFAVEGVGPGPVNVTVTAGGCQPAEEVVAVPPGGEATFDPVLVPLGKRALAVVKGLVQSAAGKPLKATLRLLELEVRLVSGADGRFSVRVPGGTYSVVIEAPDFQPQKKVVVVADGDQAIFSVVMHPVAP